LPWRIIPKDEPPQKALGRLSRNLIKNMIRFEIKPHSVRAAKQAVEIFDDDELIGVFYPLNEERGVRLVSKYLNPAIDGIGVDPMFPPALEVRFKREA